MTAPARATFRIALLGLGLLGSACAPSTIEVDHPFYLTFIDSADDAAVYRCLNGPDRGCAHDEYLPGPTIFAAGANAKYVAMARHPRVGDKTELRRTEYYYFARVPEETHGWGLNPEKVVGPLTKREFERAKTGLGLPELSVSLR